MLDSEIGFYYFMPTAHTGHYDKGGWLQDWFEKEQVIEKGGVLIIDDIDRAEPQILARLTQMFTTGQIQVIDKNTWAKSTIDIRKLTIVLTVDTGKFEALPADFKSLFTAVVKLQSGCRRTLIR